MDYNGYPYFLSGGNYLCENIPWCIENGIAVSLGHQLASMEDIAENDYNLNIPLYVEKIIEDNLPSVEEAMADLKEAWNAAQKSESVFKQKLKEFII